jgi:hypothetical protein
MREDNAAGAEMTTADNPVRQVDHHAYACWDSEETRHFYEDILGMPLVATVVLEDPLRKDGALYCQTFFEIAEGNVLAFFEQTSLFHPKEVTARSGLGASHSTCREMQRCGSSSASWMRPVWPTCSRITEGLFACVSMIQTV